MGSQTWNEFVLTAEPGSPATSAVYKPVRRQRPRGDAFAVTPAQACRLLGVDK